MVRSARELGAGLAGDARALWPNTARSESKLPAQCVCVRAGVRARGSERVSERARGGGAANCFTLSTLHRRGRARQPGDAHIPPRSPQANVPQITGQNPPNRNGGNGQPLNMDEGIPHLQERQLLEHRDFIGLDYASLYMCKPKRSLKRDDTKDTYKLPHRLIEKKRRDRINECIAQLKDLLPEHLKLTTLGHLEKAVVLELTLKHLKALTALTEQQHQKIIALQNGERSLKSPVQADLDAFHSGFQTCAKEVLQYLARFESWTPREPRCAQLVSHLHAVATQLLTPQVPQGRVPGRAPCSTGAAAAPGLDRAARCVPVIQRTQPGTEPEHDTDTDSGYGGEAEQGRAAVKQEPPGDPSPAPKRPKLEARSALLGPEPALLGSLVALGGGAPFAQPAAAPFCLPFYLLSPSAAAYVQPWLDKSGLDKYLYPAAAAPFPLLYPGIPAAAAAAAAAFPCLSSVLSPPPEKAGSAAGAPLLAHEVAPPGPLRPQHAHSRTHLPRAGNPECSQEDASLPAKDAP
ncbi:class E basic helix-loop-helix protein 41 [Microtus ochrogaster]|uniref:Class E basic helix-loop-helix protein 41 n=2 Tax=Microtus TaxID=10053 RepID=A0ABM0LES9_MICOH|nr:class E basic helix-loop-helix protein 41 [Microtus ochrogaster]